MRFFYATIFMNKQLTIEPYNPNWEIEFKKLSDVLATALNGLATAIQHVGSTAIPGLIAKPVLDIDIIIDSKTLLDTITLRLEKLHYIAKGEQGVPGRFAFRQSNESTPLTGTVIKWQQHHLYVCYADSLALKNHLLFKEALLKDNTLIEEYAALKKSLLENAVITRAAYNVQKTDFILSVLAKAGLAPHELAAIKAANT
jgi:GrpB-like predicted nucleotidyltransferase (UPF0157 family)